MEERTDEMDRARWDKGQRGADGIPLTCRDTRVEAVHAAGAIPWTAPERPANRRTRAHFVRRMASPLLRSLKRSRGMSHLLAGGAVLGIALGFCSFVAAGDGLQANRLDQSFHHSISVSVSPPDRSLRASDSIYVSADALKNGKINFLISKTLSIENVSSSIPITRWYTQEDVDAGLFKEKPDSEDVELVKRSKGLFIEFGQTPPSGERFAIAVVYSGVIHDSLQAPSKSYAKGFETTTGLIGDEGVFLSNESGWYPFQFDRMFSFRMKVDVPSDWKAVSQGDLAREYVEKRDAKDRAVNVWLEPNPAPELYLVAGKYFKHEDQYNGTEIMTYTYEPSDSLCGVYIDATKRYLAMYNRLIGQYPFSKFALVENFWQTGFGMPSFTLLGSKVIRLPFIVNTSYGHEILHNWWGNSVYVDYDQGNWCEGLTTYGADYLYKEQASPDQAREYRHHTLIAFSNYVTERKDFPLSEFLERSDAASQSVGYGKSLMVYHMLKKSLGDSLFWDSLRAFYEQFKFKMASWNDLANVFNETSGQDLTWFFDQWVKRPGAPLIRLANVNDTRRHGGHVVTFTVQQDSPPFIIDLPVKIKTTHGSEDFTVRLGGRDSTYSLEPKSEPLVLAIDPDFDTFRKLYLEEIPITLGSLFAQDSVLVIVGGLEDENTKAVLKDIASSWDLGGYLVDETPELETRASVNHVWLMGKGNILKTVLAAMKPEIEITEETVTIGDSTYTLTGNTFVCALRNAHDHNLGIGIVLTQDTESLRGLSSRLPHYSAYSYLLFDKAKPILRGVWKERRSPLTVDFRER